MQAALASVTALVAATAEVPDAFGVTVEPEKVSSMLTMPIVMVGGTK